MAHAPSSVDVLALAPGAAAVRSIAALLALRPGVPVEPGVAPALGAVLGDLRGLAAALRDAEAAWSCGVDSARAVTDARRLVDALARLRASDGHLSGYARAAARVAPADAPLAVPLALLHPPASSSPAAGAPPPPRGRDATEHQAARDVERDALRVNGVALPGAAVGYTGVLAAVIAVSRRAEGAAFGGSGARPLRADDDAPLQAALLSRARAVAVALLRHANRTVSGGDGYDAASRMFAQLHHSGGEDAFVTTAREHLRRLVEARRARAASADSSRSGGDGTGRRSARGGDGDGAAVDDDADGWGWGDTVDDDAGGGGGARAGHGRAAVDDGGPAVLLVADSKAAPPIEITIDVGPFQPAAGARGDGAAAAPSPDALARAGLTRDDVALADECASWTVGLRATIRAVTVYRLLDAHPQKHSDGLLGRVAATYVRRLGWAPDFLAAPLLQAALERAQQRQEAAAGGDAPTEMDPDRLLQRLYPTPDEGGAATGSAGDGDDADRRHLLLWRHVDAQLGLRRAGAPPAPGAAGGTGAAGVQQPAHVPPLAALAKEAVTGAAAVATMTLPLLPVVCGDGGHVELAFTPAADE